MTAGQVGKGGGGGGCGIYEPGNQGICPGSDGGSGVVIIRIPNYAVKWVTYPVSLGKDENGDDIYPEGISVFHIPEDQPHIDEMGDESVIVWGGIPPGGDHHGWDGDIEEVSA